MASRSITRPGRIRSTYRRSSSRSGSSALARHPAAVKRFGRRNRDLQQVPRRLRTGERAIVAIVFSIDGAITSRIDHREVIWLEALSESAQSASSRCSESVRLCAAFVSTRNCAIELQRARQSPTTASNSSRSRVGGRPETLSPRETSTRLRISAKRDFHTTKRAMPCERIRGRCQGALGYLGTRRFHSRKQMSLRTRRSFICLTTGGTTYPSEVT